MNMKPIGAPKHPLQAVAAKVGEAARLMDLIKPLLKRADELGQGEQEALYTLLYQAQVLLGDAWHLLIEMRQDAREAKDAKDAIERSVVP